MVRCPVCTKIQVAYIQGPTHRSCYDCGARWIQHGARQERIMARHAPESATRSMEHPYASDPAIGATRAVLEHQQMPEPGETRHHVLRLMARPEKEAAR